MTIETFVQRIDDLVSACERIAESLEALEVLLRTVAAREAP